MSIQDKLNSTLSSTANVAYQASIQKELAARAEERRIDEKYGHIGTAISTQAQQEIKNNPAVYDYETFMKNQKMTQERINRASKFFASQAIQTDALESHLKKNPKEGAAFGGITAKDVRAAGLERKQYNIESLKNELLNSAKKNGGN